MFEPKTLRHYEYELSAMLKAAAQQDPEGLVDLANMLSKAADEGIRAAAAAQREANGFSWAQYGRAAGTSAWAAQKRFGAKAAERKAAKAAKADKVVA